MIEQSVIERLILLLGDGHPSKAAVALGKYPSQVTRWRRQGYIPAMFALVVEQKTGGVITAREILLEAARLGRKPKKDKDEDESE